MKCGSCLQRGHSGGSRAGEGGKLLFSLYMSVVLCTSSWGVSVGFPCELHMSPGGRAEKGL